MIFTVGHSTKAAIAPDATSAAGRGWSVLVPISGPSLGTSFNKPPLVTNGYEWYASGLTWHVNADGKYQL